MADAKDLVTLGRIAGVYGVRGWVKIHSFTEPRDNIIGFDAWVLMHRGKQQQVELEEGRRQANSVVAKLRGVEDRDEARQWVGAEIAVRRDALPPCAPGEYYWTDLEGLAVVNVQGEHLGRVDHLIATGVHDVIVLDGTAGRLIPFVNGQVIREVDLAAGRILVDWDPRFWD